MGKLGFITTTSTRHHHSLKFHPCINLLHTSNTNFKHKSAIHYNNNFILQVLPHDHQCVYLLDLCAILGSIDNLCWLILWIPIFIMGPQINSTHWHRSIINNSHLNTCALIIYSGTPSLTERSWHSRPF